MRLTEQGHGYTAPLLSINWHCPCLLADAGDGIVVAQRRRDHVPINTAHPQEKERLPTPGVEIRPHAQYCPTRVVHYPTGVGKVSPIVLVLNVNAHTGWSRCPDALKECL